MQWNLYPGLMVFLLFTLAGRVHAGSEVEVVEALLVSKPCYITVDGTIEAVNESTVSSRISGEITKVYFDINDYVEAQSVILETDSKLQQAALNKAEGALREARTRVEESRLQFQRSKQLVANKTISQAAYEQAQAAFEASKARLESAQAAYNEARLQLGYTQIKAPYSGIVKTRHVEVGEKVMPGTPLMTGLSLEKLRVFFDVPQKNISYIRDAGQVSLKLDDGQVITVSELTVFPYVDMASRSVRVRGDINVKNSALLPGMFVKVKVPQQEKVSVWLPRSALVRRSELSAVYVLDKSDRPQLRLVRKGVIEQGQVEILAGVDAGERVVADSVKALSAVVTEKE